MHLQPPSLMLDSEADDGGSPDAIGDIKCDGLLKLPSLPGTAADKDG